MWRHRLPRNPRLPAECRVSPPCSSLATALRFTASTWGTPHRIRGDVRLVAPVTDGVLPPSVPRRWRRGIVPCGARGVASRLSPAGSRASHEEVASGGPWIAHLGGTPDRGCDCARPARVFIGVGFLHGILRQQLYELVYGVIDCTRSTVQLCSSGADRWCREVRAHAMTSRLVRVASAEQRRSPARRDSRASDCPVGADHSTGGMDRQ